MDLLTWIAQPAPFANQYHGSLSAVNKWAQAQGAIECPGRAKENIGLIETMFNKFYDTYSKVPKDAFMQLGAGCAANETSMAQAIHDCTTANFQGFGAANTDYYRGEFRKAVKMAYGVAMNMSDWAYPACCYYYTAKTTEAQEGASADFTTKHLASTEDEKSSRVAAIIRATPLATRRVTAYGNILTSHSGAIKRGDPTDSFLKEIKLRQKEFGDTHIMLCNYFAEHYLELGLPPRNQFTLIDGVTFVTGNGLDMYEFFTPTGGATPQRREGSYFVHYSISATQDGKAWAAHHLALAKDTPRQFLPANRTALTDVVVNGLNLAAVDASSYMRDL
jgi:hypothetical protein